MTKGVIAVEAWTTGWPALEAGGVAQPGPAPHPGMLGSRPSVAGVPVAGADAPGVKVGSAAGCELLSLPAKSEHPASKQLTHIMATK